MTMVFPRPSERVELVEALVHERLVADGEDLVDEQHVRVHVDRDAKPSRMYIPEEYVLTGVSMKS